MKVYLKERRTFLSEHPRCANCSRKSKDLHHKRGRIGALLTDKRHWVALCRECHDFVRDQPDKARERGLLCAYGLYNTVDRT